MVLIEDAAAMGFGLIAAGLLVAGPLVASPRRLLQMQVGVGLAYAAHFALLDLMPAAAMNVLAAGQALAALGARRSPRLAQAGYGIIPTMWLAGALVWSGPLTILAVGAMTIIAVARMQRDEMALRWTFLAGSLAWFAHDAIAGAVIPMCADLATAATGLAIIVRRTRVPRIRMAPPGLPSQGAA